MVTSAFTFIINLIDKMATGYKTYIMMFIALALIACQWLQIIVVPDEVWSALGITTAATWKMSMDRTPEPMKKKKK